MKEFDRKDRVLDHIRTHIDLQPFVCRDAGWYVRRVQKPLVRPFLTPCGCDHITSFQRFCSKPDLLQHEKNKEKTQCDQWYAFGLEGGITPS